MVGSGSVLAGRLAWHARKAPATTGHQALLGRESVVRRVEGGTGQVLLDGAWWTVRSNDAALTENLHVRAVDHDGLELIVEPARPAPGHGTELEDRP